MCNTPLSVPLIDREGQYRQTDGKGGWTEIDDPMNTCKLGKQTGRQTDRHAFYGQQIISAISSNVTMLCFCPKMEVMPLNGSNLPINIIICLTNQPLLNFSCACGGLNYLLIILLGKPSTNKKSFSREPVSYWPDINQENIQ